MAPILPMVCGWPGGWCECYHRSLSGHLLPVRAAQPAVCRNTSISCTSPTWAKLSIIHWGADRGFVWDSLVQCLSGATRCLWALTSGSLDPGWYHCGPGHHCAQELLIPIFCGVFLVEILSVTLQVSYFKYTKKKWGGRRIFLMSPAPPLPEAGVS